ncbi:hypothetical protein FRC16_008411 [Serendipita sp. 398]|nr:hypothetical protein FRC16_008411 [Serendipita sp. 398]
MPSDPSPMGHQSPSATHTMVSYADFKQIMSRSNTGPTSFHYYRRWLQKNPNQALPIVDRKRRAKPMNMRELEERIPITTSAASGRAATPKMDGSGVKAKTF